MHPMIYLSAMLQQHICYVANKKITTLQAINMTQICKKRLVEEYNHRIRNLTRRDTLLMLGGRADIGLHTPARERRPCS